MNLEKAFSLIREIPDYPIPGVLFRDITPLLANSDALAVTIGALSNSPHDFNMVAGVEARGFILGSAMATHAKVGFVPIRKAGKLPHQTYSARYGLEYGSDTIEVHIDALGKGDRVLLVDDVLATGGTLIAALELLEKLEAHISEVVVLLEITALEGRRMLAERFPQVAIRALVSV